MPITGVSNLYYAKVTKDDATGASYAIPVRIQDLVDIKVDPTTNSETFYADNVPKYTETAQGEIKVDFTIGGLSIQAYADLFGETKDAKAGRLSKGTDIASDIALGFVIDKNDGQKRFVWLLKGKLQNIGDEAKTKEGKTSFQAVKCQGTFVCRNFDNAWKYTVDTDENGYVAAIGDNWFKTVVDKATP